MFFGTDFIINNEPHGPVAQTLQGVRCDIGLLRPYFDDKGRPTYTVNSGRTKKVPIKHKRTGQIIGHREEPIYEEVLRKDLLDAGVELPVNNATSMTRDQWLQYDSRLIEPRRDRLVFWNQMMRVNTFTFNGLGTMMLEHETVSDPGKAYQDMYGTSEGTADSAQFQPEGQPIPITHCSFRADRRKIEAARRQGQSLSTRGVDWASRRCQELVEDVAIGVNGDPLEWGESSRNVDFSRVPAVYGALNFPDRLTKTDLTVPTGSNATTILQDVLEMRGQMYDAKHYGPYGIYHSIDYDAYLDLDYAVTGGNNPSQSLRQRLLAIGTDSSIDDPTGPQIRFVRRLDRLTPTNSHAFTMIMVSLDAENMRALNGMPITVFQYEVKGGWEVIYKVACIWVPEFFCDFYGNCGVLHARAA